MTAGWNVGTLISIFDENWCDIFEQHKSSFSKNVLKIIYSCVFVRTIEISKCVLSNKPLCLFL